MMALVGVPKRCHTGTMNLDIYVERFRQHLAVAAEAGGDDARQLAERLTAPLESAARLILLEALAAAADEITREMAPGTVEVRLRSGDPAFVVAPAPEEDLFTIPPSPGRGGRPSGRREESAEDSGTSRLNLRLPESLKQRIEEAAGLEGLSLNAWLVRAAAAALGQLPQRRSPRGGESYSGWVR